MTDPHLGLAAIDRPLLVRKRADLIVREQWFAGARHFVIKDPLAVTYAYLTEQEHFVLELLDGTISTAQILARFDRRFAPQQLTAAHFRSFLIQLHRSGLVFGESPGQGAQLTARRGAKNRFSVLKVAEKLLALRWRGIDPEPLLARLQPYVGWLFSRFGVALWMVLVIWAAALVVMRWDELWRRLPSAADWLAGGNVLWLALATIFVKTLHELGHALMARRVGCRVHEIGVQVFFLLPCLYTNVSDVWLVPSKWRRIAVSAAGIYVELLLAAIATLLWFQAEPGVFASLCLSVMLVASLGTLILNGNPLMRYDGYYILSDLIEVPNLEQRSRTQLVAWLTRSCIGTETDVADGLTRRSRPLLAAFAAASLAYRAAVLVGVYFASRALLAPFRLEPLSDVLLAGAVLGMVIPLAYTLGHFLVQARRRNELHLVRLAITGLVIAGLVAVACLVPLPQRISAPAIIEPRGASHVYVTVAGTLQSALPAGTRVEEGQVLARLASPELQRDLARLQSESLRQELYVAELETARGDDPTAAAAIPAARQSLADLQTRLAQVEELIRRLELVAPHAGIVLPPPQRQAQASPGSLATWTGTPLDLGNRGSFLETGTLVCLVGKPGEIEAVAVVDQADVPLMQPGREAWLAFPQWPQGVLRGKVEQVARIDADKLPINLAAAGALPQRKDASGQSRSLQTTFQVRVRIESPPEQLLPGATGRVQVSATPQTIAARVLRWLGRTFRFGSQA
jgi:putative peptide zinc metalloprotease protein